jgi:glycosyltransferase involved in cell wall biosynthesis
MISYLIATKRGPDEILDCLSSIHSLPEHDYEVIVCSPQTDNVISLHGNHNILYVGDYEISGSVHAFHKAYSFARGDYICLLIEDIALPPDFLNILDWMNSDFMKKKTFKVVNLGWDGGPGLYTYGHDDLVDGTSFWRPETISIRDDIKPYSVVPLPFFERKTIDEKLGGFIFNPAFRHHYVDHWLGLFLSKNETFEPHKWRCPVIGKYKNLRHLAYIDNSHDAHDFMTLKNLAQNFEAGKTSYV